MNNEHSNEGVSRAPVAQRETFVLSHADACVPDPDEGHLPEGSSGDVSALSPQGQEDQGNFDRFSRMIEGIPTPADLEEMKQPQQSEFSFNFVTAADVQEESIEWLDDGFIPKGFVGLLEGNTGVGKSLVATEMIAAITRGLPMPGSGKTNPKGNVLIFSEDSSEHVIRPRLRCAGADLDRVSIYRSSSKRRTGGEECPAPFLLEDNLNDFQLAIYEGCLLYTSPSPRDS